MDRKLSAKSDQDMGDYRAKKQLEELGIKIRKILTPFEMRSKGVDLRIVFLHSSTLAQPTAAAPSPHQPPHPIWHRLLYDLPRI